MPPNEITDGREGFERFYRAHVSRVTRFASRRCASSHDVADVVASTFLAALRGAATYDRRRGDPVAWLLGIARHEVAALHERGRRDRALTQRIAGRDLLDEDDISRLEAQIDAQRLAPAVQAALTDAPISEREVFLLVAADGLNARQAAQVLGISHAAARARLARARRRLRTVADHRSTGALETA